RGVPRAREEPRGPAVIDRHATPVHREADRAYGLIRAGDDGQRRALRNARAPDGRQPCDGGPSDCTEPDGLEGRVRKKVLADRLEVLRLLEIGGLELQPDPAGGYP